ncbi:amino acid ABC transporter permease [Paenibacillus aurantius]|uniref:Amino acid ABC transporter permease n=1 Tax=Paenibacillus aurantius TaxID=2918900 RepID=A0AA96REX2_9BACL|nr:amino acid ABC transporter permease [Paenibacillus aurantius]WJH35605.1 amino acid ABC transporter permease [Paenibacillus sp. CC-CFT747]WNQ10871.1 amino acid ABC transporter permease [Paenibacillus aurantius]
MIDFSVLTENWRDFLEGFYHTVLASVLALAGSFLLGTLVAVLRITPSRVLNGIGAVYVELFRNIPLLLVVYIFYIGLPAVGIRLPVFVSGTLGLMVYTSSYIAEAIRAGIASVPKGQMEAARSSGLTYVQAMRLVILPQAIKLVIPPISNQFLNLVKNSSILGVIAGFDLMYYGDIVDSETFQTLSTYFFVGLFYLVLTIPLSYASVVLERRLARSG